MWKYALNSLIRPFKEIFLYFAVILILCLCLMPLVISNTMT